MLSLDAVTMISMERKLFQTVSTLLSRHFPLFVSKLNFWPFFPNLCLLMVNHLIPALLLLKEILSLDAVKIICMKRKLFHVVSTPFSWHYPSLAWITIFFSQFARVHGQSLDSSSAFLYKNVITRCCCNDRESYSRLFSSHLPAIFRHLPKEWLFGLFPLICTCSWAIPWPFLHFFW